MTTPDPAARPDPATATAAPPPDHVYLTADLPPLGGRIKERPEDFFVDEQPLYQPSGRGEHIYLFIEKRDLSTMSAARILAHHFGVHLSGIGYAGLKDRNAVTRQLFSVHTPGKTPEDFPSLKLDRMGVLWSDLHDNKLRKGHLAGNRFVIKIRGVSPTGVLLAQRGLLALEKTGVPNRIGDQRFGYMGRNHLVGRAVVLGRWKEGLDALLGPRGPGDDLPDSQDAGRRLYAEGRYADAIEHFSRNSRAERRVLAALIRGEDPRRAMGAIERPELEFYLSAFQSVVFNTVLERRLREGTLGTLREGDLAMKSPGRAVFAVTAADLGPELDARLAGFDVSPSGPMWAAGMMRAAGAADAAEVEALGALGVTPADLDAFEQRRPNRMAGARRAMRVRLTDPDVEGGVDEHGPYVRVAFDLPRGAFATEVLRELMKPTTPGWASGTRPAADDGEEPTPAGEE